MKLAWSKSEETDPPQAREIVRNCGQVLGLLEEVLPFRSRADRGRGVRQLTEGMVCEAGVCVLVEGRLIKP